MWIPATAKVEYDPYRPGLRKVRPGNLVVADVDPSIAEYYRWWVMKRHGLKLQNTAFIPHVTIINGKTQNSGLLKHDAWRKHHKKIIELEYSCELEQHWKFWVLPARGEQLDVIRKELGLPSLGHNFHITFGRMD
jgi:hypothetical protein